MQHFKQHFEGHQLQSERGESTKEETLSKIAMFSWGKCCRDYIFHSERLLQDISVLSIAE